MMIFGEWSLPISTHQPSLYFVSPVQLQRGVTKWLWWVSGTQPGSAFHKQATQDLGASLQSLRAGLYLEKAGVAMEGRSYHLPRDYMSAYATLCGGSRDTLGEVWALEKLAEVLQVLAVTQDFLPTPWCAQRGCDCWHQQEARWFAQPALQQKERLEVAMHFRWAIGNQAGIAKQMVSH